MTRPRTDFAHAPNLVGRLLAGRLLGGRLLAGAVLAGAVLAGCGSSAQPGADGSAAADLAAAVARWPASWTVTGTHAEATYVEHIRMTRRADEFELAIAVTAQGTQSGGTWTRTVRVGPRGTIADLDPSGCGGSCAELDGVRGYLAAAVVLSLHRSGVELPAAVLRTFGARSVICSDGDTLYAAAGMPVPGGAVELDPCFDATTGAVVAQYAPALGTFGGPTLDTHTLAIST